MTTAEFIKKLDSKIALLQKGEALQRAVLAINTERTARIFERGLNTSGSKIGDYSTKTMLATKGQFLQESKFKQSVQEIQGVVYSSNIKTRQTKAKKGAKKKVPVWIKFPKAKKAVPVMIIDGGYKQFRAIQGRESSFANLRYTNELQNDLGNGALSKGASGIVKPTPIKISNTKYRITLKKDINIKKVEGLEKKFGKFLGHTKEEKELFQKVYAFEVEKILK